MDARREDLAKTLEAYYRGCGWRVRREGDGTIRADGTGGVTWIGMVVVPDDLRDEHFEVRVRELSDVRMPVGGERCPLELLPHEACAAEVRSLLERLRLRDRVSVYSVAA